MSKFYKILLFSVFACGFTFASPAVRTASADLNDDFEACKAELIEITMEGMAFNDLVVDYFTPILEDLVESGNEELAQQYAEDIILLLIKPNYYQYEELIMDHCLECYNYFIAEGAPDLALEIKLCCKKALKKLWLSSQAAADAIEAAAGL